MDAEIVVVDGPREAAAEAARRMAAEIERVLAEREWCFVALPGGHFTAPIYDALAHYSLDWAGVEFFFTDERCVPPSHPASSFGEAFDRLFNNPRIGEHQIHRIEAERPDRQAAAEQYARELPEAFDVLLLEMGADGHVASLMPGSPAFAGAVDEYGEPLGVAVVETAQKPRWRITLCPEVLAGAEHAFVVACGRDRAATVRRALREEGPASELPARVVGGATWILDRAAAAALD